MGLYSDLVVFYCISCVIVVAALLACCGVFDYQSVFKYLMLKCDIYMVFRNMFSERIGTGLSSAHLVNSLSLRAK